MARAQACALCCLKLLVVLSVVLIAAGFLLPDLLQYALDMGVSRHGTIVAVSVMHLLVSAHMQALLRLRNTSADTGTGGVAARFASGCRW